MVRVAGVYGSKITLIGDFAQMGAPEAGGLLRDLAALPAAVELTAVRRFRQPWEADASLQLRARQPDIAATYRQQGRIVESSTDTVFDDAAAAWWADTAAGHRSLIVVDTASDAADVNTRCQHHLMVAGQLGDHVADAADGCRIHIGDVIQTRRNTRQIPTSDRQRILNRDVWTVTDCQRRRLTPRQARAPGRVSRAARRLRRHRRRARLRHHHRRCPRPHRRSRPRRRHATHIARRRSTWACPAVVIATTLTSCATATTTPSSSSATSPANKPSPRPPNGIPPGSCRHTASSSVGRPEQSIARQPEPPIANDAKSPTGGRHANVGSHPQCAPPSPAATTQILDVLVRLPNNDSRRQVINSAASSVNWRKGGAADQFLQRLSRASAKNPLSTRHTGVPQRMSDKPSEADVDGD